MSKISKVSIVGRANVGKSTLFNRLSSKVKSLTLDYEGITRDILRDTVEWQGKSFELIDTGGISFEKPKNILDKKVYEQAFAIIEESDIILFLVDGSIGLTSEDREIANYLRKLNKKVLLVVNKSDKSATKEHKDEIYELGYDLILISAEHGLNINDLLEEIVSLLPKSTAKIESEEDSYKILLLGRPNVGKSSLINAILKEEKMIVSDIPGTTREPISQKINFYKQNLILTDTPGIRKKRMVDSKVETLMVKSAFHALKNSDIILLLIDVTEGRLLDQDLKLAFYAFMEQYKALIIVVNKYDLANEEDINLLEQSLKNYQHLSNKIPIIYVSAKTGKNIEKILPLIQKTWDSYNQSFSKDELKTLFFKALDKKPLMHGGEPLKIYAIKQIKKAPITILLIVNEPKWFGPSQLSFFENLLRKKYNLIGAPIKFIVRSK